MRILYPDVRTVCGLEAIGIYLLGEKQNGAAGFDGVSYWTSYLEREL